MKVTKVIREYVTESVEKAIPITNLCPEYDEANRNADKICEILEDEMQNYFEKRVEELKIDYPIPMDFDIYHNKLVGWSRWRTELGKRNDDLIYEAKQKHANKIREILVNLELGANRDELNEMINSLIKTEG